MKYFFEGLLFFDEKSYFLITFTKKDLYLVRYR